MAKRKAIILESECVACGCCVKVCPRDALYIDQGVFARVKEDRCVGCGKCSTVCPANVITMQEVEVSR